MSEKYNMGQRVTGHRKSDLWIIWLCVWRLVPNCFLLKKFNNWKKFVIFAGIKCWKKNDRNLKWNFFSHLRWNRKLSEWNFKHSEKCYKENKVMWEIFVWKDRNSKIEEKNPQQKHKISRIKIWLIQNGKAIKKRPPSPTKTYNIDTVMDYILCLNYTMHKH